MRRWIGAAVLFVAGLTGLYSAWAIYAWLVINQVFFWAGPVYSTLALALGIFVGSVVSEFAGYRLARRAGV